MTHKVVPLRLTVVMAVALLAMVAAGACGAAEQATPTATPRAAATPTPVVAAPTPTATPSRVETVRGLKVTAQASDFLPAPDPAQMASSQILRIRVNSDIESSQMDPALLTSNVINTYLTNTGAKLVRMKFGSTEMVPDVATGWEILEDGKKLVFTLRQGIQWAQGFGELTAQDIVNHYNRVAGRTPGFNTIWKGNFALMESVEAVDKYTVRFNFSKPDASFIRATLLYYPGVLTKLEAFKALGDKYQARPPELGPFLFSKWEAGVGAEMTKNPNYFIKGLPRLEKIESKLVRDDAVAELALRSGQIDADRWFSNPEVLGRLINNPGNLKVSEVKGTGKQWVYVNWSHPPLDNQKVRQALYYAVDWDTLIKTVRDGRADKSFGVIAPAMVYYDEKCVKQYDFNRPLAKQLLAEAGYPDGKGLRTLEFVVTAGGIANPESDFLIQYWKAIGVNIDLKLWERTLTTERRRTGEYDLFYQGGGAHVFEPSQQITRYYHSANIPPGNNNSYYTRADAIIDAHKASYDPAVRAKYVCDFLKQTSEDVASIAYLAAWSYFIANPKVQGMMTYDENADFFALETWMQK